MNKTLRQAIYKKEKCRNSKNWEKFRQHRNLVTKLQRKSINKYFIDRCVGGCKSKDFWPTVKPFLTNKGTQVHKDTILFEDNKLINDQQEVCGIFNHFFVNVAKNIGQNAIPVNENHPSILKIKDNLTEPSSFEFKPIK